ncbi:MULTISPECIES: PRC-barrel domain-containing protein [unclassified Mesorhizobium]|uniref:PRC-barrel domain-containing protein n=1 Tax=unclassified Mesorhizobium TaxID=325217 RepID=UPI000FCC2736|nr:MULTISPECIES: PRC-barrel domain-containing protein [unclassified Mesorhizobium]RUX98097.1 PRC-barrel domain containing protein [Mesorhizobium sp. M7D.F.Ca.US.004.01.2.1]RVA37248.1 PRC-barrel domain containing protein [Mesorhizobium sp. M7D.F.Ca.US.004.03.1.1]
MFYKLLATTALATFIASGAYAGNVISAATAAQNVAVQAIPDGKLVSKFMGVEVYNGTGDNAEDIGEVNDILLSKDGTAKFLIIGVGGFLKVGEKNVAYDFDKARWAEKNGKRWLVISATKEELTALPAFDTKAYDASLSTASTKPATPTVTPAPATSAPTVDRTTLTEMPIDKIRAEDLIGTTVYGADDANVGKIGDVVLTGDKKIDAVIIDVGGFLGIGAKEVAVGFEKLKFMTDKDGNKYLYTNFTKDQLTAQTAYDKGTYVQSRDKQRLIVK